MPQSQPWQSLIQQTRVILDSLEQDMVSGKLASLDEQAKLMIVKGFLLNSGGYNQ